MFVEFTAALSSTTAGDIRQVYVNPLHVSYVRPYTGSALPGEWVVVALNNAKEVYLKGPIAEIMKKLAPRG